MKENAGGAVMIMMNAGGGVRGKGVLLSKLHEVYGFNICYMYFAFNLMQLYI